MIDSHRREDDAPLAQHLHIVPKDSFPTFKNFDVELSAAILSLVVVLLPGILMKLLNFSATAAAAPNPMLSAPSFVNSTLLIGFVLALYSLSRSKENAATRTITIFTLIVCVLRFVLPS